MKLHKEQGEIGLVSLTAFGIFAFTLIGCGITSWKAGRSEGISGTIKYFEDQGIIEFEDED